MYRFASHYFSLARLISSSRTRRAPPTLCCYVYIVYCVFCSFASLSNSSCFVFLFQKKRKKYCSSYSVFARAFSPYTHTFRLQKIKVSRAKIFKKNYPSPRRFAPSLPFVDRSLSLLLPPKHLSLPTDPALGNPAESKGKRTVTFSSWAPSSHRRRWGHTFDVVLV